MYREKNLRMTSIKTHQVSTDQIDRSREDEKGLTRQVQFQKPQRQFLDTNGEGISNVRMPVRTGNSYNLKQKGTEVNL